MALVLHDSIHWIPWLTRSDLSVYLVWESLACQNAACSMHFSGMQKEPAALGSRVWGKGDCGPFESPGRLVPSGTLVSIKEEEEEEEALKIMTSSKVGTYSTLWCVE